MHTHRPPDVALWDHDRAPREQWTHGDHLGNQRMGWLIWSEGLSSSPTAPTRATASTRWCKRRLAAGP